jgi:hypothetical protein
MRILKFSKVILLFAILTFFSVGFLGLGHTNMTMSPSEEMPSGKCFMPGMTEVMCQMNPFEHIAAWQSMFTAVPSQNDVLLLLVALLALALGALCITSRSTAPPKVSTSQPLFSYHRRRIPIFDPLQEAFSNGILHPKIF